MGHRPRGDCKQQNPEVALASRRPGGTNRESDLSKRRLRRRSTGNSRAELWTPTRDSMAKTESPAAAGGENGQPAMQVREGHASEDGGGGRGREPRGKEGVRGRLG